MFVLHAQSGKVVKNQHGQMVLLLHKTDVDRIIMFSDRPYRIVKYIMGKELATAWGVGENSFKDNPPNAVLVSSKGDPVVIVLTGIKVDANMVSFTFHHTVMGHFGDLKNVSIIIDGAASLVGGTLIQHAITGGAPITGQGGSGYTATGATPFGRVNFGF